MTNPTDAIASPTLSNSDITDKLRQLGVIENEQQRSVNRVKVDGTTFFLGDEQYVYNPKTKTPAMTIRILGLPIEYQAFYFTEVDANMVGRPNIADQFCKSYFDIPEQAREHAEDGTPCRTCPVNPFLRTPSPSETGRKCSWRGDLQFQLLDDDGTIHDETVWTLSLPTTGMMEFKGIRRNPEKGHVGEFNFNHLLAQLAIANDSDDNPSKAIFQAFTAAQNGLVIAEVRAIPAQSQDGSRRYNVTQLTPIRILEDTTEPKPELAEGTDAVSLDDLPF